MIGYRLLSCRAQAQFCVRSGKIAVISGSTSHDRV